MRSTVASLALAAAAGALWGLCFGREPLSWASWLALAPLVLFLGRRRPFLHGFVHGLASWLVSLSWIPPTLVTFGQLAPPVAAASGTLLCAYLALYHGAFAAFGAVLWIRFAGPIPRLLLLPALWVALEWLRTYLFGGFPWNPASHVWLEVPGALELSAWVGGYGITFLVLFANTGIALTLHGLVSAVFSSSTGRGGLGQGSFAGGAKASVRADSVQDPLSTRPLSDSAEGALPEAEVAPPVPPGRAGGIYAVADRAPRFHLPMTAFEPSLLGVLVPLLLFSLAGRWSLRQTEKEAFLAAVSSIPVAIVQPNIPNQVEWDEAAALTNYRRLIQMTADACRPGVLVLWPESAAWPFLYGRDAILDRDLETFSDRGCSIVLNTSHPVSGEDEVYYNSALLLTPGAAPARYDKRHLVPFGEYVPLAGVFSFIDKLARQAGNYRPGNSPVLLPFRGEKLGPAICYEVIFPEEVADLTRAGATVLVTVTNDAWYGDTAAPWQHFAAARFRAAEQRRPLLRAAITGVSAIVRPDGSVMSQIGVFREGLLRGWVPGRRELSPYARCPWLVPLLASLAAVGGLAFARFRRPA